VDEIVLSLYAKGLTTGEISAHFVEVHGASASKETISRITDRVIKEMQTWQTRPLEGVYSAVFIDASERDTERSEPRPWPISLSF
jgi:transposase-like protein